MAVSLLFSNLLIGPSVPSTLMYTLMTTLWLQYQAAYLKIYIKSLHVNIANVIALYKHVLSLTYTVYPLFRKINLQDLEIKQTWFTKQTHHQKLVCFQCQATASFLVNDFLLETIMLSECSQHHCRSVLKHVKEKWSWRKHIFICKYELSWSIT